MKNRLFSVLMAIFLAFPFFSCSLPQDSLEDPLHDPQPQHSLDGVKVGSGEFRISDIKYSPDGTSLAVASTIGILIYDTKTYDKPDLITWNTSWINSIAFSPDGNMLASTDTDRTVRLWDVNTGYLRKRISF